MVKTYLRYEEEGSFGVISSREGEVQLTKDGHFVLSSALEHVQLWNIKTAEMIRVFRGETSPSTCVCLSPDEKLLAIGYQDGYIRIFEFATATEMVVLNGHRKAITCMKFVHDGAWLVSGSRDTDVIIWDVVAEQGLHRFKGHKDAITAVALVHSQNVLLSASKDTFVKAWDVDSQHCFQTMMGHPKEVWSFSMDPTESIIITGSTDHQLRVYRIDRQTVEVTQEDKDRDEAERAEARAKAADNPFLTDVSSSGATSKMTPWLASVATVDNKEKDQILHFWGSFERASHERVVTVQFSDEGDLLFVHNADRTVEAFKCHDDAESKRRMKRRIRRLEIKEALITDEMRVVQAADAIKPICILRSPSKVVSLSCRQTSKATIVACGLLNNSLQCWKLVSKKNKKEEKDPSFSAEEIAMLNLPGHRADVRTVAYSPDGAFIATGSATEVKIWSTVQKQCVRTLVTGHAIHVAYVPGGKHLLVATKEGGLEVHDLASGDCLHRYEAHKGAVRGLALRADCKGFVTGGSDRLIKFWNFEMLEQNKKMVLSCRPIREMEMTDDVLAVRYSPNGKFIAVALLDTTVKIYHTDTLKFHLSLYGHRLPVTSMDISNDSTIIVTASSDKNIKIWGLDYGDCHRSLKAHDGAVMNVQFSGKSHYCFTVGKDGKLKYWDCDSFQQVQSIEAHHDEAWGVSVGARGERVATCSNDRSVRIFSRTDDQLFLEEEKEKELEEMFDKSLDEKKGDEKTEERGSRMSREAIRSGEVLIEAIELVLEEEKKIEAYNDDLRLMEKEQTPEVQAARQKQRDNGETPEPLCAPFEANIMLMGQNTSDYLLKEITRVKPAQLEPALLVLPFHLLSTLFQFMKKWVDQGKQVEVVARLLDFSLTAHGRLLSRSVDTQTALAQLGDATSSKLEDEKETMGFNTAGLCFVYQLAAESQTQTFKEMEEEAYKKLAKKKKKKGKSQSATIMRKRRGE